MLYLPDILSVTYFKFISLDETFGSDKEHVWALMKQDSTLSFKKLSIPDLKLVNGNKLSRFDKRTFYFLALYYLVLVTWVKTHYLITRAIIKIQIFRFIMKVQFLLIAKYPEKTQELIKLNLAEKSEIDLFRHDNEDCWMDKRSHFSFEIFFSCYIRCRWTFFTLFSTLENLSEKLTNKNSCTLARPACVCVSMFFLFE